MSEQNTEAVEVPADTIMVVAAPEPVPAHPVGERTPFLMPQPDGEEPVVLWAVRPKNALLFHVEEKLNAAEADESLAMDAYRAFLAAAVEEESSDHLWDRLADPRDELDVQHLRAMTRQLIEKWQGGARPTKSASASGRLPRSTGRPSTARARSKGSTPKP